MEKPIEVLNESVTTIADREGKYLTFIWLPRLMRLPFHAAFQ